MITLPAQPQSGLTFEKLSRIHKMLMEVEPVEPEWTIPLFFPKGHPMVSMVENHRRQKRNKRLKRKLNVYRSRK